MSVVLFLVLSQKDSFKVLEHITMKTKRRAPYPLRIPDDLKQWIQNKANKAGRSLNAELNQMLKRDKEKQEKEIST